MKAVFLILGIIGTVAGAVLLADGKIWGVVLLAVGIGLIGRPFGFSKRIRDPHDQRPDDVWEMMTCDEEKRI